ncbi:MAG TPA: ribonuclease HI [Syntrophomonadaceae bacterium]|nr:ribonuclease HI [Syntrophomonadaceae bacterium]
MKEITIYTDGACSGNPGPGGWGAVLLWGEHKKEIYGSEANTTNQRMEIKAVIEALKAVKVEDWDIYVYSDSAYVVNAFQQNWLQNWQRNGWLNSKKEPVANQDLWKELLTLAQKNRVHMKKVKGHAGDHWNERCDELARQGIKDLEMDKK